MPDSFRQYEFNDSDVSFLEVAKNLNDFANENKWSDKLNARRANELLRQLRQNTIIYDFDKYTKFIELGNFGLDKQGLSNVYQVTQDIIKDINTARQWIESYKQFRANIRMFGNKSKEDIHKELLILGQSILGRAIELCPMDTGYLRSSGTLYDFYDYIIIAFTAPYATFVHENLEISHPWHMDRHGMQRDCGGRAKFLELAVQEFFPDRHVWVEIHGYEGVAVKIGLNPDYVEYSHYN